MQAVYRFCITIFLVSVLGACAGLQTHYETPQVSITSINLDKDDHGPIFNIGLRVVNPNRVALPIEGMTYQLEVDGYKVLSGAKADFPEIAPYETTNLIIQASPDLLASIRLLNQVLNSPKNHVNYAFSAKMDVGRFIPAIKIVEKGRLDYAGYP